MKKPNKPSSAFANVSDADISRFRCQMIGDGTILISARKPLEALREALAPGNAPHLDAKMLADAHELLCKMLAGMGR